MKFGDGLETLGTNEYLDNGRRLCGVFEGSAVEYVELPVTLKRIEYGAFMSCKSLMQIRLPERVEYISKLCFFQSALESVQLSPALRVIDTKAFRECENLKSVVYPRQLEKIGVEAFYRSGLENVVLPPSLRVIAQGAFAKCKSLRTVVLNEGLEILGTDEQTKEGALCYGVFEESAVERVQFPSTLRRIEYCAFKDCACLKRVVLPERLEFVGKQCFRGSSFWDIAVPPALKTVGESAFAECANLKRVELSEGTQVLEKGRGGCGVWNLFFKDK